MLAQHPLEQALALTIQAIVKASTISEYSEERTAVLGFLRTKTWVVELQLNIYTQPESNETKLWAFTAIKQSKSA